MSTTQAIVSVAAVLILDADSGERLLAKYYGGSTGDNTLQQRKRFEALLSTRTRAAPQGEVVLCDNMVVVYRVLQDVLVCVCGRAPEASELLLGTALECLVEALAELVRGPATVSPSLGSVAIGSNAPTPGPSTVVERRSILEHYDVVALAVDEVVHRGIVLEINPREVVARVQRAPPGSAAASIAAGPNGAVESDSSLSSALSFGVSRLRSFLSK